jgi:hypothetical protein
MLLIYTPRRNPRIKHAVEVCFKHIFKIEYKITTDLVEFEQHSGPSFWYAKEQVSKKPGLIADDMMLNTEIIVSSPGRTVFKGEHVLFPTSAYNLPDFDLFAAVFWYVSRMEEYNYYPEEADRRFFSHMSISHKIGVVDKPIVNIWIKIFIEELKLYYPELQYDKPTYKYIPSIDVDSVFMYKHKGFIRSIGGLLKDIFRKNFKAVLKRINVLMRREEDPWFCFDKINNLHNKYSVQPYYFFLVAKYGHLDKNVSPRRKSVKKLIYNLYNSGYSIGLHTSYNGNKQFVLWEKELKRMQKIVNSEIFSSRQHYIFVEFPKTYQNIVKLGMKRDYSMVYSDKPGFRLGTTVPVPFFDLETNTRTELWLYPTMIMDVSLARYQKLTPEEALVQCEKIINYTKEFGGTLITLWHNESLSGYDNWAEWEPIYEKILKMAVE